MILEAPGCSFLGAKKGKARNKAVSGVVNLGIGWVERFFDEMLGSCFQT